MKILKQRKAFTLMEMLIAVAIVIVFLAIGMPFVANQSKSLKMTELDNYAKTIYLEAQNQMMAKRAEGSLDALITELENNYSARRLTSAPKDYEPADNAWNNFYYITGSDAITSEIVPNGVIMFGGSYIIELNPSTGDIYGVFYQQEGTISYAAVTSLADRSPAERQTIMVGYYGGEINSTLQQNFALTQTVEAVNGEELYLKISYVLSSKLLTYYSEALMVDVTIEGAASGAKWNFAADTNTAKVVNGKLEIYILLDSMLEGYSFAEITAAAGAEVTGTFLPGEDLKIKVVSTYQRNSDYKTATGEARVNSLFGKIEGNIISIGAVRHLRNLNGTYFNPEALSMGTLTINQTKSIDFDGTDYVWTKDESSGNAVYSTAALKPSTTFAPISNDKVFSSGTTYNGSNNALKNFIISATADSVGIIESAENMIFQNIKIENVAVRAADKDYVGGFAGRLTGCTVTKCGVYLTIKNESNSYYCEIFYSEGSYANEMEERCATYTVTGKNYVGGFAGYASNTRFTECFGAIDITAAEYAGGFVGYAENGTEFNSCYGSGALKANMYVGGFVGHASGITAENCYSTGNLYVNEKAAGFAGISSDSVYSDCYAVGSISNTADDGIPTNAGCFLADTCSANDTFTNCSYLKQEGYNVGVSDAAGITGKFYSKLKEGNESNSSGAAMPYKATLIRNPYPFTMVTERHYGNWPAQYVIDTSLVYYEVYEDGTYGYYCVTTLSEAEGDGTSNLTWVLDSLQDAICVEDGYALLTLYNLSQFTYDLHVGSVLEGDANYDVNVTENVTVTTGTTAGANKAVLLRQQTDLTFRGYEGNFDAQTNFDLETASDTFAVTGMYLYQLPYELQRTDRSDVSNFYDRLIIYNGLVAGNSNPVIGSDSVDDTALTFYYCPHFARNAVNPGIWSGTQQMENPDEVYVRSARQLNALSNFTYYWNTQEGYQDIIYFVQEVDICFSTYVTVYCGEPFDLMDTSNEALCNKPIGNPVYSGSAGRFNNSYNGNGNAIIDYCLESSDQFVGFFGECEGGVIENIIMTVSEPGKGYIRGTYSGKNSTAVGGILGLSYLTRSTVRNCSISGYTVEYRGSSMGNLYSISVGGLVGISMGDVYNCAATCDVKVTLNGSYDKSISIGGLAGSSYYKSLEYCYSGGTIDISATNPSSIDDIAAGGIAGAIMQIWNDVGTNADIYVSAGEDKYTYSQTTTFKNLYTYTKINIDATYKNTSGITYIAPVFNIVTLDTAHTDKSSYGTEVDTSAITLVNCYYLEDTYADTITGDMGSEVYGAIEIGYSDLVSLNMPGMGRVWDDEHTFPISEELQGEAYDFPAVVKNEKGEYVHYGDWPFDEENSSRLLSSTYPAYFEVYVDGTFGLYYLNEEGNARSNLDNSKDIGSAGYGMLSRDKDTTKSEIGTIQIAGVTYYIYAENTVDTGGNETSSEYEVTYEMVGTGEGAGSTVTRTWYINTNFGAAISKDDTLGLTEENPLQVRTADHLLAAGDFYDDWTGNTVIYMEQTRDLDLSGMTSSTTIRCGHVFDGGSNSGYVMENASVIVFERNNGVVRNLHSLGNTETLIHDNNQVGTMDNVVVENAAVDVTRDSAIFGEQNQGTITNCTVIDSSIRTSALNAAGFVLHNTGDGTISNCGVLADGRYANVTIDAGQAHGFAQTNAGRIEYCYATGTVVGGTYAAGFIASNIGEIEYCYANCINRANYSGGLAYGFIGAGGSSGTVISCYSAGRAAAATAYGFTNGSTVKNSYSVTELAGNNNYGFSASGTITGCYWGYATNYNNTVSETGMGTRISLADLADKTSIGGLNLKNQAAVPYNTSLEPAYPYLSVNGLTHYGDWPDPSGVRGSEVVEGTFVGLFYYEKYADSTYGVYAIGIDQADCIYGLPANTTEIINTLGTQEEARSAVSKGYGIVYSDDVTVAKWKIQQGRNNYFSVSAAGSALGITVGEGNYKFRIMQNNTNRRYYSQTLYYGSNNNALLSRTYTLGEEAINNARPD